MMTSLTDAMINVFGQITPILFILFILGILAFLCKSKKEKKKYSYGKTDFMNSSERNFFFKLIEALPDFYVFPQVSLIELIKPLDFASKSKILSLHVDFTIFNKDLKKCCVIELDGYTHNNGKQQAKDHDRDNFLAQAEIKVLRYKVKQNIPPQALREDILNALS